MRRDSWEGMRPKELTEEADGRVQSMSNYGPTSRYIESYTFYVHIGGNSNSL